MDSILYQLYRKGIRSGVPYRADVEERRKTALWQQKSALEQVRALDEALHQKLIDLFEQQIGIDMEELPEEFARGFCMGAKLMTEIFTSV